MIIMFQNNMYILLYLYYKFIIEIHIQKLDGIPLHITHHNVRYIVNFDREIKILLEKKQSKTI